MMPEFDGYEVCERIRADPSWASTKIFMLTARGRDSERDKGLALGADAYVTKPFSTRELMVADRGGAGAAVTLAAHAVAFEIREQ